MITEIH